MLICCKVGECPYNFEGKFCAHPAPRITINGMCGHIYFDNGNVRPNWKEDREGMYVMDIKIQEMEEVREPGE